MPVTSDVNERSSCQVDRSRVDFLQVPLDIVFKASLSAAICLVK